MNDSTPIVIFVRHAADCTWDGLESTKKDCTCRKHLRWSQDGKQYRRKANTRSWTQAEKAKRELEDELSGKADIDTKAQNNTKTISGAVEAFLEEKRIQGGEGVTHSVLKDYERLTERLSKFAASRGVYNVKGITRELLTAFVSTWPKLYPSSFTRVLHRQQLRAFLNFCYQSQWLVRVPQVVKMTPDASPTQPLTDEEYKRLIDAVYITITVGEPGRQRNEMETDRKWQHAVATYLQTMRWTGLAPIDVITLRRDAVTFNAAKGLYHIKRGRTKTGVQVSIPTSKQVGDDLLKVDLGYSDYFFWNGQGTPQYATTNWSTRFVTPVFKAAGISSTGNMLSYRLRDTFAVHLLVNGASMEDVAKLLGNSIAVCERHYAKWSKLRQDKVDTFVSSTFEQAPVKRNRKSKEESK
jgi:site-specific recombinase XerD